MNDLLPIILHADLDCFYCQVEQLRLNISPETPTAVQQWNSIIAVNYPARKAGVKRHSTIQEAKTICPEIVFMHVATFEMAQPNNLFAYHDNPSPKTHKVSLEPYRNASRKIFEVFRQFAKTVEKASVDEAFIDITDIVHAKLLSNPAYFDFCNGQKECLNRDFSWDTGLGKLDLGNSPSSPVDIINELRLLEGAKIAQSIRNTLLESLKFTCSIGIAHNKTIAKICSGYNKPNQQTAMTSSNTLDFFKDLPISKIRFMGGKLGTQISDSSVLGNPIKAGDLWEYSINDLAKVVGDSASWVYNIVRGIDTSSVTVKQYCKSLLSAKAIRPAVLNFENLEKWLKVLCAELTLRITEELQNNNRFPKTFTVNFSGSRTKSRQCEFSMIPKKLCSDSLFDFTLKILIEEKEFLFPCSRISISVSSFFKFVESKSLDSFIKVSDKTTSEDLFNSQSSVKHIEPPTGVKRKSTFMDSWLVPSQNYFACDKCKMRVEVDSFEVHQDYHFALELAKTEK